ncbi:uncharacterized protein T551_01769 [Pneumocystis jirovecii RU7]|uniref:DUF3835 domain-containing protein n=1 Tax=Pneumocystis jirovecii (strain RU7) TaxID=1408657 RepID=A0A0W4ZQ39_PNEJ7|nr:uncharacterized protein T551_01769 [Pneumocystis jirovecii RU7]KTW30486.1 hypothetical protein T551_01769 [Pneumocystis jirovecii RU7]
MNKANKTDENWTEICSILQKEYKETEENLNTWKNYQKEYEKLRSFLVDLPKTTQRPYLVPFSQKAYIPGTLIHTNEILVLFGENWFVERSSVQAIDIVDRRLKYVKERLEILDRQCKDIKFQLDHTIEMNQGKIYNEEGLPIVEIREELNEDGSIAHAEVFDRLAEPWLVEASNEFLKKLDLSSGIYSGDYSKGSSPDKDLEEISPNIKESLVNKNTSKTNLSTNVPTQKNMETMIDLINEIDEQENNTSQDHSYDNSDDSEVTEDQYGRTRGFISPLCIQNVSSKTSERVKKVTFSDSIETVEEDCPDTQNAYSPEKPCIKKNPLIKDVVERPLVESTEHVLDELESSLHRREIAAEYYRLKQKIHAQNEHLIHNNFNQEYKDNNFPKKKVSRFKAAFMEKKNMDLF